MSKQLKHHYTIDDYFTVEMDSELRHEYFNGEIYAMVGGSLNHCLIKDNVSRSLGNQLAGRGCRVMTSDLRVKTQSGLYTYPDLSVICEEPTTVTYRGTDTLRNPSLIVEVLSKSTASYDKGSKFEHYKSIESLSEYVLIDQYEPHVIIYVKQKDGSWKEFESKDIEDSLHLPLMDCSLVMKEVYAMAKFQQPDESQ